MATRQASPQEQVSDLPILPTILVELLSIPLDDKDYFNKIEKLAERDPPLALKIIQLSNTAKQAAVKPIRSIKDAIVGLGFEGRPFRHFCTGEVISDQGLFLTNHHCGFAQIQSHSSLENDYLKDGF